MQTEAFHDHSVKQSKGSVNPYVNFSDLAWYEFALPPIEEQHLLASLLQASDCVVNVTRDMTQAEERVRESLLLKMFSPGNDEFYKHVNEVTDLKFPREWELIPACKLSSDLVTKGATPSGKLTKQDTGIPFIKVYNLTFTGELDFSVDPTFVTEEGHRELERSRILPGDILMNIVGPPLGKISIVPDGFPEANINQAIVKYRPKTKQFGFWLAWYLQSPWAQHWLLKRSKKTSGQRNLTLEMCRELPIPVPPAGEMQTLIDSMLKIEMGCQQTRKRIHHSFALHKTILKQSLKV